MTRPRSFAAVSLLVAVACGDASGTTTTTTAATGEVRGTVTAGPMCPVVQEGVPCPDRPVAGAVIWVTTVAGVKVTEAVSDAAGAYAAAVPAGDYLLVPQPVEGLLGTAATAPVTVAAGATVIVDLSYDTGIR